MITKEAKRLRKLLDKSLRDRTDVSLQSHYSNLLADELIDHCRPTMDEFQIYTNLMTITGRIFFRLIMEAKGKWDNETL